MALAQARSIGLAVGLFGWVWALTAAAAPKCPSEGLYLFPKPGSVVPTNARFILEGVGSEQTRVQSLLGHKLMLVSDEDAVSVAVEKGWISSRGRVAVVLRPKTPLQPDRTYTLALREALPGNVVLNGELEDGKARWHSGKGPDLEAPKWLTKPAAVSAEYSKEGGALRRFTRFHLELDDAGPLFLVVSLRRARGPTGVQTYFVPVNGNEAWVGHDFCSGAFAFEDGRAYRARIDAQDLAGNAAPMLPLIEFQAPQPKQPQPSAAPKEDGQ